MKFPNLGKCVFLGFPMDFEILLMKSRESFSLRNQQNPIFFEF